MHFFLGALRVKIEPATWRFGQEPFVTVCNPYTLISIFRERKGFSCMCLMRNDRPGADPGFIE